MFSSLVRRKGVGRGSHAVLWWWKMKIHYQQTGSVYRVYVSGLLHIVMLIRYDWCRRAREARRGWSMHCNVYRVKLLDRCTPHNNNNKMNQTGLKSGYRWIWRHSIIACKFSRYPLFALYFRTCALLVAEAEIEFGVDRWGAVYLHLERIKHNFSPVSSVTFFSLGIADWGEWSVVNDVNCCFLPRTVTCTSIQIRSLVGSV